MNNSHREWSVVVKFPTVSEKPDQKVPSTYLPRIPIEKESIRIDGKRYNVDWIDWDFDVKEINIHLGPF